MIGEQLWVLDEILAKYPGFKAIERLQTNQPLDLITQRAEQDGIPVVIENYHQEKTWKGDILSVKWIEEGWSSK